MTGKGWLLDPTTREPLPAVAGEVVRTRSTAAHMAIERDASGVPVRMRWVFCDDPKCCPPFPDRP